MPSSDPFTTQTNDTLLAIGAALALVAIAVIVVRAVRRWRDNRVELTDPPPLLIPVQRRGSTPSPLYPPRFAAEPAAASLAAGAEPSGAVGGVMSAVEHRVSGGQQVASAVENIVSGPGNSYGRNGHALPGAGGGVDLPSEFGVPTATRTNGATPSKVVHTIPPMDGTLQFLPGRLEIVDGENPGRDIRFVRTWGEVPEITFGRVTGPPFRHVQLRSQTVSRQHARMQYVDGRWKLTNLSQTNPVVINGQALDAAHGSRVLHEGDQIEMGEVVFRFRER